MTEPAPLPDTLGLREFADYVGKRPSYITSLKQQNRLVLTDNKRRVKVAESLALIADCLDPAKAGVVARHAAQRAAAGAVAPTSAPARAAGPSARAAISAGPADEGAEGDIPVVPAEDPIARQRAAEQLAQERLKRRALERQEAKDLGQLLEREPTIAALVDFVTVLRNRLQGMPARLAPELGAADEARCQVLLGDEIEHALADLERKFIDIGKEP